MAVVRHVGQKPCICSHINPIYSFATQIITIPFLWHLFPNLQQVRFPFILFDGAPVLCNTWKLKECISHQGRLSFS